MKQKLFDGSEQVTHITILCMFKNNEDYLKNFFFDAMNSFEKIYDVHFDYIIHENNSKDSTKELLKTFIRSKSKKSQLTTYDFTRDYKNIGNGKNNDRIANLSKIRNKLVESARPLTSVWNILIDSNIFFQPTILTEMFSCNPTNQNIGMFSPYTQQLMIPGVHISSEYKKPVLLNHYYDTFSFFDTRSKTFWPFCAFEKCNFCSKDAKTKTFDRHFISRNKDIVDVNSAFGGFAIIHKDILNNSQITWDTCSHDSSKDESLCEHFLFCFMAKRLSGKRIVLLQNVDKIHRTF